MAAILGITAIHQGVLCSDCTQRQLINLSLLTQSTWPCSHDNAGANRLSNSGREHLILWMCLSHERCVKMVLVVDLPLVWYVGNTPGVVVCGLEVNYIYNFLCQQFLEVLLLS